MTYGEIYDSFVKKTGIDANTIEDYRPCIEMYEVPYIPCAIVIWLKDKTRIIYISEPDNTELIGEQP